MYVCMYVCTLILCCTIEGKTISCINIIKGAQIGPSLKNLAERRTDIFGSEETMIGRKVHTYTYVQYIRGIAAPIHSRVRNHKPPTFYAYTYFPCILSIYSLICSHVTDQ